MKRTTAKAYAKLNLSLDVTGTREDGYHLMDMVNCSVSLCDRITFIETPGSQFSIHSNLKYIPVGEKNLIWKAAHLLGEAAGIGMPQVRVNLEKNIPTQAGLGGGSADAAAALLVLNSMLKLGLTFENLSELALMVGADVPFCLKGGAARVRGIGEQLETIEDRGQYYPVIVMPGRGHSTGEYFKALDSRELTLHPDTDRVVKYLAEGKIKEAMEGAFNVFEVAMPDNISIGIETRLKELGSFFCSMTGTGAAVFGVFETKKQAENACRVLREEGREAWATEPCCRGVEIVSRSL